MAQGDENVPKRASKRTAKRGHRRKNARPVERIEAVMTRLCLGQTHAVIEHELSELWGCGRRTVQRYIEDARNRLAHAAPAPEERRKEISQGLAMIGQRALDSGKLDVARRVYADMARLNGLLINREELSGPGGAPLQVEQRATIYLPADRLDEMPEVAPEEGAALGVVNGEGAEGS